MVVKHKKQTTLIKRREREREREIKKKGGK
jgi:hypothetical protein